MRNRDLAVENIKTALVRQAFLLSGPSQDMRSSDLYEKFRCVLLLIHVSTIFFHSISIDRSAGISFPTQSTIVLAKDVELAKGALPGAFEVDVRLTKSNSTSVDIDVDRMRQRLQTAYRQHQLNGPNFDVEVIKMTKGTPLYVKQWCANVLF